TLLVKGTAPYLVELSPQLWRVKGAGKSAMSKAMPNSWLDHPGRAAPPGEEAYSCFCLVWDREVEVSARSIPSSWTSSQNATNSAAMVAFMMIGRPPTSVAPSSLHRRTSIPSP